MKYVFILKSPIEGVKDGVSEPYEAENDVQALSIAMQVCTSLSPLAVLALAMKPDILSVRPATLEDSAEGNIVEQQVNMPMWIATLRSIPPMVSRPFKAATKQLAYERAVRALLATMPAMSVVLSMDSTFIEITEAPDDPIIEVTE